MSESERVLEAETTKGCYITAADGVPLAVVQTGKKDAIPILFLSGFGFDSSVFVKQFRSSLAERFRLIAIDLRGHGGSGKPSSKGAYSRQAFAQDVTAALSLCRDRKPIVVGWSFGAIVFLDWLRENSPDMIAGFVSVGSNGGLIERTPEELKRRGEALASFLPLSPDFHSEVTRSAQFVDALTYQPLDESIRADLIVANMRTPLFAAQAMAMKAFENHDLTHQMTCKTLFLSGEHDAANPAEPMAKLASELAYAKLIMMPDTGHAPFLEAPDAFNTILAEFAEEIEANED